MSAAVEVTADDLSMQYDEANHFPFVEDENCNITGYGHQDKAEFATAVNRYDEVANGEGWTEADEPQWTDSDISHHWAKINPENDELLIWQDVTPDTPGAFPITTLWGQR